MSSYIPLTRGFSAEVDLTDLDWLVEYGAWYTSMARGKPYARQKNKAQETVYMHREIAKKMFGDIPRDKNVMFIDGDTLNCTRENLALVDFATREYVKGARRSISRGGFAGVVAQGEKWKAFINVDQTSHFLGLFDTAEEAAKCYNQKASETYGKLAILNEV